MISAARPTTTSEARQPMSIQALVWGDVGEFTGGQREVIHQDKTLRSYQTLDEVSSL